MRLLEFFRPFRVIITRRVTEEEQVSVERICKTMDEAKEHTESFLGIFRDHRKRTNEEVVRATQLRVTALETDIRRKTEQMTALDEEIDKRRKRLNELNSHVEKRETRLGLRPNGPE